MNEQSTWCDTFDANTNNAVSIIDRTISELLKIKEIIQNEIKENDKLITSGLGNFPKNIYIGE